MIIDILQEAGYEQALYGLSLSYNQSFNIEKLHKTALTLSSKDKGHNKFLESIVIWMTIKAPLYWWKQFDAYRIAVTKQSESTMHTIMKQLLTQKHFEYPIYDETLQHLNNLIEANDFHQVINDLPMGFLQSRVVHTNYKVIRHIIQQRITHKLNEWTHFCTYMISYLQYSKLLGFNLDDYGIKHLNEHTTKLYNSSL